MVNNQFPRLPCYNLVLVSAWELFVYVVAFEYVRRFLC